MYEEQRLIAAGMPLSDAVSLCHSLRKEQKLDEFMKDARAEEHVCHCGEKCEHCTCGLR